MGLAIAAFWEGVGTVVGSLPLTSSTMPVLLVWAELVWDLG